MTLNMKYELQTPSECDSQPAPALFDLKCNNCFVIIHAGRFE